MALDTATIVAPGTTPGSHPAEPSLGTLFRRILAAEWTKLRSVRSTTITLAVTVLVCVGLGALFCYGMVSRWDQQTPQERSLFDPASFSLNALFLGQLIIGALGVLVISAEYSTGKAVVFAGVALLFSLVTCFAAFLLGQAILHGKGIGTSLSQPGVPRVVIGGALYLTVVGLLGLGLGTLLRNSAAGISAVVGLLFVLPILSNFLPSDIRSHVAKYLPAEAGAAIWTLHPRASESLSPWVGFGVLCAYAQSTPKPTHGESDSLARQSGRCIRAPASAGRYFATWLRMSLGKKLLRIGSTKSKPTTAEIPAALLRSSVPKPKPSSPTTVRYRAPPMTTRSTPGWLRLVPIPLPCRIAWPRRKAAKHVTRENSRATPANTTALPASMARRCGTAPRVALIVPVEYSAEMTRTPSAPMISCPRNSAFRLKDAGSNSDRSCGVC